MNILEALELEEVQIAEEIIDTGNNAELIVFNDDFNTFDWVIECFVQVCKHSYTQAEQLSLIVHFNGRATVKTGNLDTLKPMKEALIERGLSAAIEILTDKNR